MNGTLGAGEIPARAAVPRQGRVHVLLPAALLLTFLAGVAGLLAFGGGLRATIQGPLVAEIRVQSFALPSCLWY